MEYEILQHQLALGLSLGVPAGICLVVLWDMLVQTMAEHRQNREERQ